MRRNGRNNITGNEDIGNKIIKYASIGVAILAIIVIGLMMYSASLNNEAKQGTLSSEQLADLVNKTTESASTEMGKSVNEAKNEQTNKTNQTTNITGNTSNSTSNTTNSSKKNTTTTNSNTSNTSKNTTTSNTLATSNKQTTAKEQNSTKTENTATSNNNTNNTTKQETKTQELNFEKPVDGEIVKDYAKDNLLYSETLQEWTVHTGVDIKAEKTTVVKSAESGTVKSIKNDPRYGLTIVVEHANGFQTVYANLLTSEFVVEGEKVEKGQSLGTVGNTAAFESAEEPHLHFEVLKDSMQVDPSIYLK